MFCSIHRETPVFKSLFHKVADLQTCNFIKERIQHKCFSDAKFLWNTYFEEHLRTVASELCLRTVSPFLPSNITNTPVAFKPEL